MSLKAKIEIGDCFRVPLPDGRWAYCQYVQQSDELGYLVRVFDRVTSEPLSSIEELEGSGLLFPPVFVGLRASVRSGRWQKIGTMPVNGFAFPKFRITMGTKPGTYHDWRIWDGKNTVSIGELPEHMRSLELKQVWGDEGLEERIVAGTYRGDRMF
jgi:Immunity protein 26